MNRLDNLMQAINLADLDGLDEVTITLEDLLLLKSTIKDLDKSLCEAKKEINILDARLSLRALEKPIRLDTYV